MKNHNLLLCLLLASSAMYAQSDWQLFRPDVQYLYSYPNASGAESPVLGVKLGSDTCTEMYPSIKWYGDGECNESGSSFIGYEVCQTDSLTQFRLTDTTYFVVKQNAALSEPWPAWQWNDEIVWGEVLTIEESTVLGLTDSVKSVYFYTQDEEGIQVFLPASDRPMKISKQYGLIEAIWLRDFPDVSNALPVIGLSEPKTGLQNPGKADIFNLQIGDELHIRTYRAVILQDESGFYFVQKALKATITNIQGNLSSPTLRYFVSGPMLTTYFGDLAPDPDTIFQTSVTDTWTYGLSNFDYLDAQPGHLQVSQWGGASTVCLQSGPWGRGSKYTGKMLVEAESGCLQPLSDGGRVNYVEGLAGEYFNGIGVNGPSSRAIHYFRRDSMELGVPFDFSHITSIEEAPEIPQITLSPNPVSGMLQLQLPQGLVADLKLCDGYGRILRSENQVQGVIEWNLGTLPTGIYHLMLWQNGRLRTTQRILKQ